MIFSVLRKMVRRMNNAIGRYDGGTILERTVYNSNEVKEENTSFSILELRQYSSDKKRIWEREEKIISK